VTSDDEIESAKRPTAAPVSPPTLDDLLRMIEETHAETAGLSALMVSTKESADSVKASAGALKEAVQNFVNVMSEVNQRQNKIEGRLARIETWHREHGHELPADGTTG
jgi:ABC-type transporter Mla subunit MlaD